MARNMEWYDEERNRELSNLCDDLWTVEMVPVYRIKEACDHYGFDCREFIEAWNDLMDLSHDIINEAEERMTYDYAE